FDRPSHAIEQLKLETARVDPELVRKRLRMRDAANVVRAEGSGNDRFVFQKQPGERFKIRVALRLLKINRTIPAVLERFRSFVVPVCALDQTNCEARASFATPLDQVAQIRF